ncbi:Rod shape-determining protein RodA [Moorella thermoacetica]|uniref:Peptidoglycan glycosyltransferase RodA n=1 Tax=Neomoorella thermoacetica TaxID=1525 RepID=A0A1J5NS31_NEOTH|nr:Rod shape-determining protein RodA [Moorella thermoacetica]
MFERRLWRNLDYYFVGGVIALLAIGLVVLNSASANVMPDPYYFVKKQLIWILFGLVGLVAVLSIDYEQLKHYHLPLYALNIIMLAAVALVGHEAKGAQRWINLGFFLLQPSEFAKTITVITLACFLDKRQGKLNCWQDLVIPFLYVAVPLVLILKQPDLGTALVLLAILFGMLYVSGANWKLLLIIFGGGLLLTGLALFAHFHFGLPLPLQDYQMRRLVVFLNPYNDGKGGTGEGYHVIQSQIAIGSGGWWGVGLHQGSQVQLNFLPEAHTDFIFSVVGEELGFVRTLGIIALYFLILYRMVRIAGQAKDMFGALLVGGVASMFAFHILVNIGMTTGIMPVAGIPLPLFSYGGSAMLANMLALGLVLNVNLRRQKILF